MGQSTFQNFVSFAAWQCAAFALIVGALISLGGIGRPGQLNTGVELAQWHLDGRGKTAMSNYYTYRLYLHRLCVIPHGQTRGHGFCVAPFGGLRRGFLSAGAPDAFVKDANHFDPIMGRINMSVPATFYTLGIAALAVVVVTLPRAFLVQLPSRAKSWRSKYVVEMAMSIAMSSFIIASAVLTVWQKRFVRRIEWVPDVNLVLKSHSFLLLTWLATALLIVATFLLLLKAMWNEYAERRKRTFDVKDPTRWQS